MPIARELSSYCGALMPEKGRFIDRSRHHVLSAPSQPALPIAVSSVAATPEASRPVQQGRSPSAGLFGPRRSSGLTPCMHRGNGPVAPVVGAAAVWIRLD